MSYKIEKIWNILLLCLFLFACNLFLSQDPLSKDEFLSLSNYEKTGYILACLVIFSFFLFTILCLNDIVKEKQLYISIASIFKGFLIVIFIICFIIIIDKNNHYFHSFLLIHFLITLITYFNPSTNNFIAMIYKSLLLILSIITLLSSNINSRNDILDKASYEYEDFISLKEESFIDNYKYIDLGAFNEDKLKEIYSDIVYDTTEGFYELVMSKINEDLEQSFINDTIMLLIIFIIEIVMYVISINQRKIILKNKFIARMFLNKLIKDYLKININTNNYYITYTNITKSYIVIKIKKHDDEKVFKILYDNYLCKECYMYEFSLNKKEVSKLEIQRSNFLERFVQFFNIKL